MQRLFSHRKYWFNIDISNYVFSCKYELPFWQHILLGASRSNHLGFT